MYKVKDASLIQLFGFRAGMSHGQYFVLAIIIGADELIVSPQAECFV